MSVLIQCLYSALTVLIQFGRFTSLFRVLVHAKICSLRTAEPSFHKKSLTVRMAEPYPFTKNLYPFDSRLRYPAVLGLYVHKPLCLSLQTVYPLRLSVCLLSNGISKFNPTVRINSLNIRLLFYRLKRKI